MTTHRELDKNSVLKESLTPAADGTPPHPAFGPPAISDASLASLKSFKSLTSLPPPQRGASAPPERNCAAQSADKKEYGGISI